MAQGVDTQEHFENRLRAWTRYWMERRGIGTTGLEALVGKDQSYLGRWLNNDRGGSGCSAYMAYRISKAFGIDPDALFNSKNDPPAPYWRTYIPRAVVHRGGRERGVTPRATPGPKARIPAPPTDPGE